MPARERTVQIRAETLAAMLARTASDALRAEVDLTPKPGLVDARDAGAHRDMSHALMHASAAALTTGFHDMAAAAATAREPAQLRAELGVLGRESEARMMLATGGVNTHRGAIWCLGLLVAAAAAEPGRWQARPLLARVAALAAIDDPAVSPARDSNGQRVVRAFGVPGARGEAERGFPAVLRAALPALRDARAAGASERVARLNALLAVMAELDDTCVLNRVGPTGLRRMQAGAAAVLDAGGAGTVVGGRALACLDRLLLSLNASPGGSADLLAAALFVDALETAARAAWGGHAAPGAVAAKEKHHANTVA